MSGLEKEKYLSREEINKMKSFLYDRMMLSKLKGKIRGVKPYYIIMFILYAGLRVSEACKIKFRNLNLTSRTPYVQVIDGKGGKDRIVYVPSELKRLVAEFKQWKENVDEPIGDDDYVFVTECRNPFLPRSVQFMMQEVKDVLRLDCKCSPHSLRHSFALYLYEKTKDLRLVQKQLGHSNVQTTTIYSDVTPERSSAEVEDMWTE
ncbi:MAG: tyrosine-type recombinase/integrase [Candidatus Saganbacteria bacterium]|nr:tyrosine-type recombinase/integrase [Candidatus Saganbacteria bacterium]